MDQLDFSQKIKAEVDSRKGDVADAIGMPDQEDYETLLKIIQKFERKRPGLIHATLQQGRRDYESGAHRHTKLWEGKTLVNKDSNMTYEMELPAELVDAIEAVFPSMFRSKKHFGWFKKNFYKLTIKGE